MPVGGSSTPCFLSPSKVRCVDPDGKMQYFTEKKFRLNSHFMYLLHSTRFFSSSQFFFPHSQFQTLLVQFANQQHTHASNLLIGMSSPRKVALVTGANRGIGFATTRRLGELGFKVLLGARDAKRGEEAVNTLRKDKLDVDLLLMMPTDPASVEAAAQKVEVDYKRLDVLINNAGLMDFDNKVFPLNIQRMRDEFEINFFATVDITNNFLPLMLRSSEAPRLVFVSTPLGTHETVDRPQNKYAHPKLTAYKCTKSAVNMYAHNLAKYLEKHSEEAGGSAASAKVNCCYPGYVQTDMCFNSTEAHFTPYEGAETSVWLATLPTDGPTGGFYHRGQKLPW